MVSFDDFNGFATEVFDFNAVRSAEPSNKSKIVNAVVMLVAIFLFACMFISLYAGKVMVFLILFFTTAVCIVVGSMIQSSTSGPKKVRARIARESGMLNVYLESSGEPGKWDVVGYGLSEAYFMQGNVLSLAFQMRNGCTASTVLTVAEDSKPGVRSFLENAGVMPCPFQ